MRMPWCCFDLQPFHFEQNSHATGLRTAIFTAIVRCWSRKTKKHTGFMYKTNNVVVCKRNTYWLGNPTHMFVVLKLLDQYSKKNPYQTYLANCVSIFAIRSVRRSIILCCSWGLSNTNMEPMPETMTNLPQILNSKHVSLKVFDNQASINKTLQCQSLLHRPATFAC